MRAAILFLLSINVLPVCCQPFQWGTSRPDEAGFSEKALYTLRDTLAAKGTQALLLIRHDKIFYEWYAQGWNPERKHYIASLSKAMIGGTSLMLAMTDGRLKPDDRASDYIPEWKSDPMRSAITIRELATHSAGIEDAEATREELDSMKAMGVAINNLHMDLPGWKGDFWRQNPNPFISARDQAPVKWQPGSSYHYSNPGMAMLSYAITSSYTGTPYRSVRQLLRERLMEPLDINENQWSAGYNRTFFTDSLNLVANWGGGEFTARAAAKIGRLLMQHGSWEGTQLISAQVVDQAVQFAGTPLPPRSDKDPAPASGLAWYNNFDGIWRGVPRDAFCGAGAGNQVLVVIPSLDLIVVRFGSDMYDASRGEGFWYGIYQYLLEPLMRAQIEPPYPMSTKIVETSFAPDSAIVRLACDSDNWPITWGDDDNLYTAYGDGWGFEPRTEKKLSLGIAKISGVPGDLSGTNLRSGIEQIGPGRTGRKASGMLMVHGVLYMWLRNVNGDGTGSQLAWSRDHGKKWQLAEWKFSEGFGCPTFLNFGKDYADARDAYVYFYSEDDADAYKSADDMVMGRVPSTHLAERKYYEFFSGLDADGRARWTSDIALREPVFRNPGNCFRSGISYDAGLKCYLWSQTLPGSISPGGERFEGGLGIFEAPEPWGPWHTVYYTRHWDTGPGDTSSFPTKWMSPDGTNGYLVFSGNDCFSVRQVTFRKGRTGSAAGE